MSTPPTPPETEPATAPRRRLPAGAATLAGVLLLIPCVALALVPTYSRETPRLWGWPFFYWYQVLWVLLTPLATYAAYRVIQRARGDR
jgi:hypothetical protein